MTDDMAPVATAGMFHGSNLPWCELSMRAQHVAVGVACKKSDRRCWKMPEG